MVRTSGTSPVCLVIWSVWSIWLVYCNQTNQTDRTDQMNKTDWRTVSASCWVRRHTPSPQPWVGLVDGLVLSRRSADQEVGPKADSREHGDAQHHLLMPAHPRLCLADRQGAHDRHGLSLLLVVGLNDTPLRMRSQRRSDQPSAVHSSQ